MAGVRVERMQAELVCGASWQDASLSPGLESQRIFSARPHMPNFARLRGKLWAHAQLRWVGGPTNTPLLCSKHIKLCRKCRPDGRPQ